MKFLSHGFLRPQFTLLALIVLLALFYHLMEKYTTVPQHTRNFSLFPGPKSRVLSGQSPQTTTTPMASHVAAKLAEVYGHLNLTRDESIFPARQLGRYLLLNPDICRDAPVIDVIILVHTAPTHLDRRLRMRQTFANRTLFLPYQIRIAFLLGKTQNPDLHEKLELEHTQYNDTIMGDFNDSYRNLTFKGVMGFRWTRDYCPNSRLVLKTDDDVIVDTYKLLDEYVTRMRGKKRSIFCNAFPKLSMRIERTGKWALPPHVFHDMKHFPFTYCSGFIVLMTSDLMAPLHEAAKVTPFFWIDDVYLFGILPRMVGDVTFHRYKLYQNLTLDSLAYLKCLEQSGVKCPVLGSIAFSFHYRRLWQKIQTVHTTSSWVPDTIFEP